MFNLSDIYSVDLTGTDSTFKRNRIPFLIYKANQVINFAEPFFENTLVVETLSGGVYTNYNNITKPTAEDQTSMARAKQIALTKGVSFDRTLINNVTIKGFNTNNFTVYVSYQGLYRDTTSLTGDDIGPSYTPGLLRNMLDKLTYLESVLPPIPDVSEGTLNSIQTLAQDITGTSIDNYITDELHYQVNTLANRFIIRPANGSFYRHDLVVKYNDVVLVEGTDYEVTGANLGKTKISTHSSGVYDYILMLKPLTAGVVSLNYRAFGGMICPVTIDQIKLTLKNIIEYIKLGNFLTHTSLYEHPLILSMLDRILYLENMLNVSYPSIFLYSILSTDKWISVAHMDNLDNTITDVGHFKLRCGKYYSEFKLEFDPVISRQLDSYVLSSWGTNIAKDNIDYFDNRICPKFRVVYDSNNIHKGLVLQMSITANTGRTISAELQNVGSISSGWKLLRPISIVDNSTSTPLPDGTILNITANGNISNSIVVSGEGYNVFAGSLPLSIVSNYSYTEAEGNYANYNVKVDSITTATGKDILMSEIGGIEYVIHDRYAHTEISVIDKCITLNGDKLSSSQVFFEQDMCEIGCEIYENVSDYNLYVNATMGTSSMTNDRFDLKQINILFRGDKKL